ncbi:MAG: hypothetical protein ACO1SX_21385 [Actinomycetota bacterium]
MPTPINQTDMETVFAVTDELGIHRESVTVPLGKRDPGGVKQMGGGQIQITIPESVATAEWAEGPLRELLAELGYEELP